MTEHTSRSSDDPALDRRVRTLLDAASAPVETTSPLPGEEAAVAAFRTSAQRTRTSRVFSPLSAKAAVAAAIGTGVLLTGGVGAAATGVLPNAAQETASTWLKTVGISVPAGQGADDGRSEQTRGDGADDNGRSEQTQGDGADANADPRGHSKQATGEKAKPPPAADHGKQVSETAKNSTAEGEDKGKQIAGAASDGRDDSGDQGSAGKHHGKTPASPQNSQGGTASDATNGPGQSAGAADHGTATANESRNGTGSAGPDNRPAHP